MVLMSGSTVVYRKVEDVWKFINDLKALPSWAQSVRRAKWTSKKADGRGVGAKFNQTQHEGLSDIVYAGEVLEYVVNKRRATVVRHESYEVFVSIDLEPVEAEATDDGQKPLEYTKVTMTVNVPSNTWLQWILSPVASLISKWTMNSQLELFKTKANAYETD
jgi:uncharacterized protein YndB with AHSA1/START domain